MSLFNRIAAAALMTIAPLAGAQAADAITMPVAEAPVEPVVYDDPGFDWNGFYAGAYGVGQDGAESGAQFGAGIDAGYNAQFDYFVLGGELAVHGLLENEGGDLGAYGQALAKAGLVVTDDVLLYAAGGYGKSFGETEEDDALLGGGVEFAVAENVTARAQYLHGFPLTGDNPKDQVSLGANFHF
jgi:outer membrane immunogenic protein